MSLGVRCQLPSSQAQPISQHRYWLAFLVGVGVLVLLLDISLSATPTNQPKEITNSIGMKFVLIPAGKFVMGSPKDEQNPRKDEHQHEVTITKPFYLGAYTVTLGQFRQFLKDSGYQTEAEKDEEGGWGYNADKTQTEKGKMYNWQHVGWEQTDDHPVVNVTWNDAVAFCEWLSKKEGMTYRLPTEAEWEYSCRAGTKTRFYSGDDDEALKGVANIADVSFKQKCPIASWAAAWDDGYPFTAPVGKFKPNAFGLFDMHGNVWQWCSDWYGAYPHQGVIDPQGPENGESRVLRGGSFSIDAVLTRSASRNNDVPTDRLHTVGFRVARDYTAAIPRKEITDSTGMKLVLIPAGKFVMGSPRDENGRGEDEDSHQVEITKPFYMGMYTVTVGQFRQFVTDSGYQTEAEKDEAGGWGYNAETKGFEQGKQYNWQNVGWEQTDEHPVVNVSWNDAVVFCKWLSKKEKKPYRLPTEAEWEYSCRAGTKTRFYSGDKEETLKGVANIADASFKQKHPMVRGAAAWDDGYPFTAPVGKFKPNAYGLYDMHGNVWQWCSDWYGPYPLGKVIDSLGPANGERRVLRGGSFDISGVFARSADRLHHVPMARLFSVGFRVARTSTP